MDNNSSPDEKKDVEFSVVISTVSFNKHLAEACEKLRELEGPKFEVIVIANERTRELEDLVGKLGGRVLGAGNVSPAAKRDRGVEVAKGEFVAFLDDDAFPRRDWLRVAKKYLAREDVAAVGGPQLTPLDAPFGEQVSGAMFLSLLSGAAVKRFWPGKKIDEIDDWPTVNFIVKKKIFQTVGGFDTGYWPGEDTKLCLDIVKKTAKKILYVPEMVVFHHRRPGFFQHLKQVGNYGLHRGYFAKIFPETSLKFFSFYYVPSLFVAFVFGGVIFSLIFPWFWQIYSWGLGVYAAAIFLSTILLFFRTGNFLVSLATIPYLVSFHVWYGIRFIQGFVFTKELKSKLGR